MDDRGLNSTNKTNESCFLESDTQKTKQSRKLRRLCRAQKQDRAKHKKLHHAKQRWVKIRVYIVSIIFVFMAMILNYQRYMVSNVFSDFVYIYTKHYMAIVHNRDDYCEPDMDLNSTFQHLRTFVINQDLALSQLELAMNDQKQFQAIALAGPSGVGKSLTARILQEKYPWSENVYSYAWNAHVEDVIFKYKRIHQILENLPICGRSLVIIDNLTPADLELVSVINKFYLNKNRTELSNKMLLTIIYIFNLNRLLPENEFLEQQNKLKDLKDVTLINYREFRHEDLKDCIIYELKMEKMTMDEKYLNDIIESTSVKKSGCKTLHSKVVIYGEVYPTSQPAD